MKKEMSQDRVKGFLDVKGQIGRASCRERVSTTV